MKILKLFNQDGINIPGVWQEYLDNNGRYSVSIMHIASGFETDIYGNPSIVQSIYIIKGSIELVIYNGDDLKELGSGAYKAGQGWSLLPQQKQKIKARENSLAFVVSGQISSGQLTDVSGRNPLRLDSINNLSDYLVNKPWGSEAWLVENGIYVLKGITMNAGEKCSLQVHEKKTEVNLVLSGSVQLLMCYDEKVRQAIEKHHQAGQEQSTFMADEEMITRVNKNMQSILIGKYEGWTAMPFQIHRVFAKEKYFALEVSTPEVDDIVRLKDNYNRPGGRIANEHQPAG